ncbi:hypothetical protein [Maribacter ulvicola]|uniref:Uncharacterized protein n=1 Tax=Maribacter ulvicola TaxID=228959 RepID=A0A1N6WN78_9FLAO|nr:hypothetical protein [Maribacter ulvicola]SIQ91564.1 hypothetical protein SAMN05421797_104161 [Maribacter ulvicola]
MAFNNCNELLLVLQQYQLDYYTKGKALKVYSILTDVLPIIEFENEHFELEFRKRHLDLKRIECLTDLNEYSEKFAHNLLKLILIINNSKLSTDDNRGDLY